MQRGDVTLWLSGDARDAWRPPPSGQPGGHSDLAITTALTLRLALRLPLHQAERFVRSVLSLMAVDLDAPDHTTLSRRSRHLNVALRRVPAKGAIHLIVDSLGLAIVGEGEGAAARHGGRHQRGWKKFHLGVERAGVIVAHTLPEAIADDATTGIGLIAALDADMARVTADSAYDNHRLLGGRAVIGSAPVSSSEYRLIRGGAMRFPGPTQPAVAGLYARSP